ncbi:L-asparaginase 1-like isoform X2 [Maniola jurtina]|uniref:L-asparaginase 1-like isoform X2 n=1 Tax=Maniola jurtina TaxID=191418 RepID=UPI001E68EDC3|nr:L-asparaginase 1-like isoform X2 [Maniola jurtina]
MPNDNVFERICEDVARESDIQNGDSNIFKNDCESKSVNPKIETKVKKARSYVELSMLNMANSVKSLGRNERRVLVLYTGGTIGMVKNKDGVLIPQKGAFENLIRGYPQLHDNMFWRQRLSEASFDTSFLVLPEAKELDVRIFYKIVEYETLLDSSNMTEVEWIKISEDIMKYYEHYDGFVVLHGTDTLSYTASAISFMFENIGKAVVFTGSQIPIFEPRSDGTDNFVSSLLIAGGLNIPEVTVYFGSKLFRGNRTRKVSVNNLYAFDSPNCVPLVEVGIDFEVNKKAIFKPNVIEKCHLHAKMSKNVGLLRIFPSISSSVIKAFCQPPIEGVVLESYGAGNIPSNRDDVFKEIAAAIARGVIVINITQCATGSVVTPMYETGRLIAECGVISGYDMTPEAALTKLSYVLSKNELTYQQKVEMMVTNIRGELTNTSSIAIEDNILVDALATSLNIQSPKKLIEVTDKVFSALLLYAIEHDDDRAIKKMLDMGADVNAENSEGKTVLHEAILKGNVPIIEYLLKNGANVHLKTRCGETPLLTAIHKDNHTVINLLKQCGAHLTSADTKSVAEMLSLAARSGSVNRMETLRVAGADLNATDEIKQTPLHKAVLCNNSDVVRYLLSQDEVQKDSLDILGFTPLDCAVKLGYQNIIDMLNQ